MEKMLTWKRGFFRRTYDILSGEMPVGSMKEYHWKHAAYAELNGKSWYFRNKGFFQRTAEVVADGSEDIILTISYNAWSSKATIIRKDRPYHKLLWKFENFWNTKASLTDPSGRSVKYNGGHFKGTIRSTIEDDLIILAGLYIMGYMRRRSSAAAS